MSNRLDWRFNNSMARREGFASSLRGTCPASACLSFPLQFFARFWSGMPSGSRNRNQIYACFAYTSPTEAESSTGEQPLASSGPALLRLGGARRRHRPRRPLVVRHDLLQPGSWAAGSVRWLRHRRRLLRRCRIRPARRLVVGPITLPARPSTSVSLCLDRSARAHLLPALESSE